MVTVALIRPHVTGGPMRPHRAQHGDPDQRRLERAFLPFRRCLQEALVERLPFTVAWERAVDVLRGELDARELAVVEAARPDWEAAYETAAPEA
jgi:hypothetical protein